MGVDGAGEAERGTAPPAPAGAATSSYSLTPEHTPAATRFSLDAFTRDDRLRLFAFATADRRVDYLWILRAFERSRANYVVQLHAGGVAALLRELAAEAATAAGMTQGADPGAVSPTMPAPTSDVPTLTADEVTPLLDQLHDWQLLDRSFDGTRAASLAEYRNRHYVYQFTQAGFRAFRAVEEVLGAGLDDAQLSRLVWPELLADLKRLPQAVREADSATVYRTLLRLDTTLADMAERAARFYLMLSDLARTNDTGPEAFMAHKDALLVHMQEFSSELARYTPKLAAAVAEVQASGVSDLVELAAEADERVFATPAERLADWHQRWAGLVGWFTETIGRPSEAIRLQDGTVAAIGALLALLRRITESRRGGVSLHSQLRHLAAWFTAAATPHAAHALFDATFSLGAPRHVGIAHPDPELIPTRRSWWESPPVEVSRTLVETGKPASPGAPARIERNQPLRRVLRDRQLSREHDRRAAAAALRTVDLTDHVLTEAETALLFDLLDTALASRVPVSGAAPATASSDGIRLTLRPAGRSTRVRTVRGDLHLDRMAVTLG